jgi:transposase
MAAMLLVGVAVGRASVGHDAPARDATSTTSVASASATDSAPSAEQVATDRYLARTEALLAGLPDELRARRGDAAFLSRADALLLQTRLLLDSPAAADPALRALLDDLEVVLAQVVRLDARRDPVEVDFLHEALEQRDVLPRLREAVADNATE